MRTRHRARCVGWARQETLWTRHETTIGKTIGGLECVLLDEVQAGPALALVREPALLVLGQHRLHHGTRARRHLRSKQKHAD